MSQIHVLILPSNYPRSQNDISVSFFREQAIALTHQNLKVGIIHVKLISLLKIFDIKLFPKISYENDHGISTFRIIYTKWIVFSEFFKIKLIKYLGLIYFKKYIKTNAKPDIIHCHNFNYAGYIAEGIFDKYKIPFVITEHDSRFFTNDSVFNFSAISRIAKKSSLCLAVSSKFSKLLGNKIPDSPKWNIHHNIVNKIFLKNNSELKNKNSFVFISIGRLIKHKNFDLILKSFKIFNNKYPNSVLKIIGIGPEMNFLKNESIKLKINKNIEFLGELSRMKVVSQLRLSHAFVLGSIYETFGVVFIEALAQGLPILSSACDGVEDIVNNENGLIIRKSNPFAMSKGMFFIYENYENYNKKKIIEDCKLRFSEENQSKKLLHSYKKIVKNF